MRPSDVPRAVDPTPDEIPTRATDAQPTTSPAHEGSAVVTGSIGRYAVLEEIGRGGMGTVVRAYDPKLRREVALKRLTSHALGHEGEARLVREAQAMAKLSHPNVVAIYDVEVGDEGVTMVMEYVAGPTLRRWLKERVLRWSNIVAAFRQAGEGLAAAHRVGLVHRDFKPGNVLVAMDGRLKVTDFGLAKSARSDDVDQSGTSNAVGDSSPALDQYASSDSFALGNAGGELTRDDVVMGTPPYMAPEQHTGKTPDARADQYAFCVSLWHGLNGSAPFAGRAERLLDAKLEGPPAWPKGSEVPGRIAEAVRRGLSPNPGDRWPSMDALLDALAYDPGARRRRNLAIGAGVGGLALVVGLPWLSRTADVAPCTGAPAQLTRIWDEARRAEIRDAMLDTEIAFAPATMERVERYLDGYTNDWMAQHTDACEATSVRGEQSTTVLDLRMSCLQRAKVRLIAVTDVLAEPDADVVRRGVGLVRGLPSVEQCGDAVSLQAESPPPSDPQTAQAVEDQRAVLARARALAGVGKYANALALATEIETAAVELGFGPFIAEAKAFLGSVSTKDGQYSEAYVLLDEAFQLALAHGNDPLAIEIADELVLVTADRIGRPDEGHAWASVAMGLARAHDPGGLLEAIALSAAGNVLNGQGRYHEALASYERGLEIEKRVHGEDDPHIASTLANLARILKHLGRYDDAERAAVRAQELVALIHGPEHPTVAGMMNTVAGIRLDQGDLEGAERILRQSTDLRRRSLGAEHPLLAASLDNLAGVLAALRRWEEAEEMSAEAFRIAEKSLGPDNPEMALFHANVASIQAERGRADEAIGHFRRAIEIQSRAYRPDHPSLVMPYENLGELLRRSGRLDEALVALEKGWALAQSDEVAPKTATRCGLKLADSLWSRPDDRARAIEVAQAARARLQAAGADAAEGMLDEADVWLKSHQLPPP